MISVQNIIDKDKTLFTIIFDRKVLMHLQCRCDDYLAVLQSNFKPSYFLLAKADNGYRIRRYSHKRGIYQINISFRFKAINEFNFTECTYFLKEKGIIRISINN